ncbi:MAG: glycoside hydrolase family 13 protein [Ignavibacteriales bacterium]|nr:glycoside hydrolase family 13 protein [Ignavibacteriales bacterium]
MSFVPHWVPDAIFYQIFPERFENGDTANDPPNSERWGGTLKPGNYFGGDLQGIIKRIPYLKDLGINALYLNPIFAADSNHKYNAKDYFTIDPAFGTNQTFDELVKECHAHSIRIVIDGVFNHVGTAHAAFKDVKENGRQSKFASWFNIYSFPVSERKKPNYECWWGHGALPKLMVQNPDVKQHLFDVTKFWTEKGIDGWRLDVPNEIPHEFWKEWRAVVKAINPECYIVGELWQDASPWLQGDEFDATMNYRFRDACLDFFAHDSISSSQFISRLDAVRKSYPDECNYAMQNLLGSHDTERYLTLCKRDVWRAKLSLIFQMTYIGAPMIYYGDEVGMEGGKDPDCRRCMVWDEKKWNSGIHTLAKTLAGIRTGNAPLRRGDFTAITEHVPENVVLFKRSLNDQISYVAINKNKKSVDLKIQTTTGATGMKELLTGDIVSVKNGNLVIHLPVHSGKIFTTL